MCPTCRGRLSDRRNIPLERILEQLDKKKCKFDGCKFERNSSALVTEHEETCAHKTFKCKWSEQGCNFEATKAIIREHEDNCEHSLSQQLEAELSIAGAAKMVKPKKYKRNRKAEAPATLMPDGVGNTTNMENLLTSVIYHRSVLGTMIGCHQQPLALHLIIERRVYLMQRNLSANSMGVHSGIGIQGK